MPAVFITGGTGYIGRRLCAELAKRGHAVKALVRPGSEGALPAGCEAVVANPFDAATFQDRIAPAATFVQLVGVPHPSPSKAAQFRTVDLASARASVAAAVASGVVRHFVYVSVAHPAPAMHAYVEARKEGEALVRAAGLNATLLRPWYVLGPGHWWPAALLPGYWLMERLPATRDAARRLGLVSIGQMVRTLAHAVENPAAHIRVADVPMIRHGISVE